MLEAKYIGSKILKDKTPRGKIPVDSISTYVYTQNNPRVAVQIVRHDKNRSLIEKRYYERLTTNSIKRLNIWIEKSERIERVTDCYVGAFIKIKNYKKRNEVNTMLHFYIKTIPASQKVYNSVSMYDIGYNHGLDTGSQRQVFYNDPDQYKIDCVDSNQFYKWVKDDIALCDNPAQAVDEYHAGFNDGIDAAWPAGK